VSNTWEGFGGASLRFCPGFGGPAYGAAVTVTSGRRTAARPVLSALLVTAACAVTVLQLAVVPLLLQLDRRWALLLVPVALLTTPMWSLLHEAIHGGLFHGRARNDAWGRVLAIGYGSPFVLLKAGHLLHHRYSRTRRERTEIYEPGDHAWIAAALPYYVRLLGGLYLAEVASLGMAIAPARVWRGMAARLDSESSVAGLVFDTVARRGLRAFRVDAALTVMVYAGSAVVYGHDWWMLAVSVAARALLISLADNAYHYGTRLEASLEAMNLRLPRMLETYVLAFNLHDTHHKHPGLPWYALRAAFEADGSVMHLGWFAAVTRQFRGPIPLDRRDVRPTPTAERTESMAAGAGARWR
jgi:fatty acid desaturase